MKADENPKFSGYKGPSAEQKAQQERLKSSSLITFNAKTNARKIASNSKKIEKLMGMLKGKGRAEISKK